MSLATFRKNGAEVATPVWFAAADGKLYVIATDDSGKVKRLRNSQRARVAPSDARGRVLGEWRNATASILSDPGKIERARAALLAKYGWQMRVSSLFSRLTGRINHRAWLEIQL
jgi:PPOX class probable F420-dependent enzyme